MTKKNKASFKDKVVRLEQITELLDKNEVDLEEAIALYEEGLVLYTECTDLLKNASLKIETLRKNVVSREKETTQESTGSENEQ